MVTWKDKVWGARDNCTHELEQEKWQENGHERDIKYGAWEQNMTKHAYGTSTQHGDHHEQRISFIFNNFPFIGPRETKMIFWSFALFFKIYVC